MNRERRTEKGTFFRLRDRRGAGIDAPSWLWASVVDLMGSHEAGYLEHCRRYALRVAEG